MSRFAQAVFVVLLICAGTWIYGFTNGRDLRARGAQFTTGKAEVDGTILEKWKSKGLFDTSHFMRVKFQTESGSPQEHVAQVDGYISDQFKSGEMIRITYVTANPAIFYVPGDEPKAAKTAIYDYMCLLSAIFGMGSLVAMAAMLFGSKESKDALLTDEASIRGRSSPPRTAAAGASFGQAPQRRAQFGGRRS
jgi:hypothetical protein